MEENEKYKLKSKIFNEAISGFEILMQQDISQFNEVIEDGIMNGQIQKFEYCTELFWKLIKLYLWLQDGIDVRSPKSAIKEFYLIGCIPV